MYIYIYILDIKTTADTVVNVTGEMLTLVNRRGEGPTVPLKKTVCSVELLQHYTMSSQYS